MSLRVETEARDPWQTSGAPMVASPAPSDVATALFECIVNSRGAQQESAQANAERANALLERAREQIREAMERAEQADETGGIWGDISRVLGSDVASIAGALAAVALAVATGGTGLPAVLAIGAALLTVSAKAGSELGLDPKITLALGGAGALLGFATGSVAGAGNGWTTLAQVANGVQAGATGAGGAAAVREGQFRAEATDHRAQATAAHGRQEDAWLRLEIAIDMIDRACRDVSQAGERASDVVKTDNDGTAAVISRMGAA